MIHLINFAILVVLVVGTVQFLGFLLSIPRRIINWYYDNKYRPK
jgi:hypothetical protein